MRIRTLFAAPLALAALLLPAGPAEAGHLAITSCDFVFHKDGTRYVGTVSGAVVLRDPLASGTTYTCTFRTGPNPSDVVWTGSATAPAGPAVAMSATTVFDAPLPTAICTSYSWTDAEGFHSFTFACGAIL